jgi:hypothetical protein
VRALATVPESVGEGRASAPPLVLPFAGRRIAVDDRVCWAILAVAMAASAALILYLNRGTTFYADEMGRVLSSPEFDLRYVIEPHAGHLTVTSNLLVQGLLEAFGADYVPFRVLGVLSVLACAGLFYALARRRIGPVAALAPALVLLFFGSAWELVVIPFGFAVITGTALGLAALLALERDDRAGDLGACALLCLSVVTFSVGLAFTVGTAISVLLREDRWRRAWIFLAPALLYTAWWLWTTTLETGSGEALLASNVLLIPSYVTDALAAVTASLAGLNYDFTNPATEIELGWGRMLAVVAVAALVWRISRGNVPGSLWSSLGIALTLWVLGALVAGLLREPDASRYIFAGGVAVLLVATAAASGMRLGRLGVGLLFAACAFSLATNIALLREGATFARNASTLTRAVLAMADLARDNARPGYAPLADAPFGQFLGRTPASTYYAVVDEFGSPAMPLSELESEREQVRERADEVLANALGVRVAETDAAPPADECRATPLPGVAELPAGGAVIRAAGDGGAVRLGRFGAVPSVEVGAVRSGEPAKLEIPPDASPKPWLLTVDGASSVEVCALR